MTKTAIVTGCAGFIGSHLSEELLKNKWKVIGIDNFHPYYARNLKELNLLACLEDPNFEFIEGSILSDEDLKKLPECVDYVFHFAAIAGVRNSIEFPDEYYRINVIGTNNLLEKFKNIEKFIYASSSSVYGNLKEDDLPVIEDHPLNPVSPYGNSKMKAEQICVEYAEKNDSKITILRFYTVYGPRQRPDEAIMKFIRLAQAKHPIPIYGDGSKERDFTFVSDIVRGSILAATKGNGIYNLGTGKTITVNEMIEIIEKSMGLKLEKQFLPNAPGDVEKTHADISKAKYQLGYEPKVSFTKGIEECVKWCNETICAV